jgi:hypothetical protein
MEFTSHVYELAYRCEKMGMYQKNFDLLSEGEILQRCLEFLRGRGYVLECSSAFTR